MTELVIDSFAGDRRAGRKCKHGLSYVPEYRAWQTMRLRCLDPEHAAYANYGGRGITVCSRWLDDPRPFLADMGPKPSPDHELDRIDNDKGYSPENCRWVTRKVNSRNRRNNRALTFRGETLSLAEWCERLGLPRDTVRKRLVSGWPVQAALTSSVRPKSPKGASQRERPPSIRRKASRSANYAPRASVRKPESAAPLFVEAAE